MLAVLVLLLKRDARGTSCHGAEESSGGRETALQMNTATVGDPLTDGNIKYGAN